MRDVLLTIIISGGLIWGFFSAPVSILVLNWICFQRPYDFSWGLWNNLPVFKIALGVAVFSNLIYGRIFFRFPFILVIYLAILGWAALSCFFAYNSNYAWDFYKNFLPSMLFTPILMFSTIHSISLCKWVIWVAAAGIGFNAFKVGLTITAKGGGHITDQINGFVGDNNMLGLVCCIIVAVLMGLRGTLPKNKWIMLLFYIFIMFILLCIIYTKSRGALLALSITFISMAFLSGKLIRSLFFLVVIIASGYFLIPSNNFDRLSTLDNLKDDTSAVGRFENWELSWQEALRYPFFGVGPENHIIYNKSISTSVQTRVAHSVYFQVLGELGFVGLGLYLWFMGLGLWTLFRTWRFMIFVAIDNPDLTWVRDVALWMICGYMGYILGAGFLNTFYIEFPWYVIFYGSMLQPLVTIELSQRKKLMIFNN
ncbi:membrane hypothetical protein [Candidatus Competibacter denitrificans Run_A_D11]|uniref:O-antigen polymerase n=1 Tax=Candidatus Competibacter denitrificans Run_A_D11 TaxID=1400863 RepID=W6M185_9GAMM|nr:putative O-glycosylation ligase, exosortase A system-associated [Candidatus Competibacter denitrificans]CDI01111.1 membrane hypothetical protein [Candidatus Competibacter denitrificans Run_A_D11]